MIAPLNFNCSNAQTESVQANFLKLMPPIRRQALMAFRGLSFDAREEAVQEVVARAFCAFVQLVRRGKVALAYPTPLANFAIRQVRAGRQVGCQLNADDVLSPYARRIRGLQIERLDQRNKHSEAWNQVLVEDRHAGPAETAAARIDIAAWLGTLSKRNRRIASALAQGEPTGTVARRFHLTPGRISQLRAWFRAHWEWFQGGDLATCAKLVG